MRQIAIYGWTLVSGFLVPMLAFANSEIIPLILELILTVLVLVLLRRLARKSAAEACDTANDY